MDDHLLEEAFRRRDAFLSSLDQDLREREDRLPMSLAATNASARSKLRKVYALIDEFGTAARPFVACKSGCDACCHINVMITAVEARQIETATGRPPRAIPDSIRHALDHYDGVLCPLLKDSACSIYENRPFARRKHVNFDTTSYWCQTGRSRECDLPLVGFKGAEDALFELSKIATGGVLADIRDFFPPDN
jgi:hypothetical protein